MTSILNLRFFAFLGLLFCGAACTQKVVAASPAPQNLTLLDGSSMEFEDLQGKVILFVNVASKCGFTPQYEGLQKLYETYQNQGLMIIGVPCNQFGKQEPGEAAEIQSFCKLNYGVSFPILEKQNVRGATRSPLYDFLVQSEVGNNSEVLWNFEKFLVNTSGEVIGRYRSSTTPEDEGLVEKIQAALPSSSPPTPAKTP